MRLHLCLLLQLSSLLYASDYPSIQRALDRNLWSLRQPFKTECPKGYRSVVHPATQRSGRILQCISSQKSGLELAYYEFKGKTYYTHVVGSRFKCTRDSLNTLYKKLFGVDAFMEAEGESGKDQYLLMSKNEKRRNSIRGPHGEINVLLTCVKSQKMFGVNVYDSLLAEQLKREFAQRQAASAGGRQQLMQKGQR